MERNSGSMLLADPSRVSPEAVYAWQFPAVFRGYDRKAVNEFRQKIGTELDRLNRALAEREVNEQELAREVRRLGAELADLHARAPQPTGEHAVSVLTGAQQEADRVMRSAHAEAEKIVNQARHQADAMTSRARHDSGQMEFHARQHCDQIVRAAQDQARGERMRIITTATEEARAQVAHYQDLGVTIQKGLQELLAAHLEQQSEWEQQVSQPPQVLPETAAEPFSEPADG